MNALDGGYDSDATMLVDDADSDAASETCGEHPTELTKIGPYTQHTHGKELCEALYWTMNYYQDNIMAMHPSDVKLLTKEQIDRLIVYLFHGKLWAHKYHAIWAVRIYFNIEFDEHISKDEYVSDLQDLHHRMQNDQRLPDCFRDSHFRTLWGAVSAKAIQMSIIRTIIHQRLSKKKRKLY